MDPGAAGRGGQRRFWCLPLRCGLSAFPGSPCGKPSRTETGFWWSMLSGAETTAPGDIVIVGQAFSNQETIVKRVVATAGQTVDIDFETGSVYVDGVELDEPYIRERTYTPEGDGSFP